jgi:TatD DNase family protein
MVILAVTNSPGKNKFTLSYNIYMLDVHCHLNLPQFSNDLEEVLQRAKEKDVEKIINTGTTIEDSQKAVELSEKYENLYAIVGIHPHEANKLTSDWIIELEKLAKNRKVVGIGEIGLDYFNPDSAYAVNPKIQKEIFIKQIELAIKLRLPLQIHSRKASKDIIEILQSYKNDLLEVPGMFHCMAGNIDYLKKALNLGFYIGFDGNITYEGLAPGEDTLLKDLVSYTPLERTVLETDAPFLTPIPKRGGRNEPSYVIITAEFIGKIKNTPFKKINKITTKNANKIFKL